MSTAEAPIEPAIPVDPKILNLHRWGTSQEAADFSGSTVDALRLHRYRGTGARFSRHGRIIRYWMMDVHRHLCEGLREGGS